MNLLRVMLCSLALTAAGAAVLQYERTETAAPAAPNLADARRADLAVFREQFMGLERSYTPATRAKAEARLARLETRRANEAWLAGRDPGMEAVAAALRP